ncbi:DUF3149 domain-containing protein [Pseudoalteromonas distincta]
MSVFFRDFFTDPVLFMSFGFLTIVVSLCIFFAFFFLKKIHDAEIPDQN